MALESPPTILLLGGGYTLKQLACRLPHGSFVITSRSPERCAEWRALGWIARQVSTDQPESLHAIHREFPKLTHVVDSIPPLRNGGDCTSEICATLEAFADAPSSLQFIYLSTTGVFGVRDGSWVDEDSPAKPWNPLGEARLRCEERYRSSKFRVCATRLPAIYGPGRGLQDALARGSYKLVGDGSTWSNRIHVTDLVTILAALLKRNELPSVLCVSDDAPTTAREVVQFYCSHFNLPWPPSISADEVAKAGNFTMLSNQRVRNARVKQFLDLELRYPSFREGALAQETVG